TSRRRHTRSKRDWSSDVCSSDLTSSSLPPKGRSTSMSVALSGSTTHSRPRAETKEPGAYVVVMGWVSSRRLVGSLCRWSVGFRGGGGSKRIFGGCTSVILYPWSYSTPKLTTGTRSRGQGRLPGPKTYS